jgi:hypothetical protein
VVSEKTAPSGEEKTGSAAGRIPIEKTGSGRMNGQKPSMGEKCLIAFENSCLKKTGGKPCPSPRQHVN